jgi:hypothetical protein
MIFNAKLQPGWSAPVPGRSNVRFSSASKLAGTNLLSTLLRPGTGALRRGREITDGSNVEFSASRRLRNQRSEMRGTASIVYHKS